MKIKSIMKQNFATSISICFGANVILWLLFSIFLNEVTNIVATLILYGLVLYFAFRCDKKLAVFHSLVLVTLMASAEYIIIFLVSYILHLEITHFKNDFVILVEEAFACLLTQFAVSNHFLKKRLGSILLIFCLVVKNFHNCKTNIKTD